MPEKFPLPASLHAWLSHTPCFDWVCVPTVVDTHAVCLALHLLSLPPLSLWTHTHALSKATLGVFPLVLSLCFFFHRLAFIVILSQTVHVFSVTHKLSLCPGWKEFLGGERKGEACLRNEGHMVTVWWSGWVWVYPLNNPPCCWRSTQPCLMPSSALGVLPGCSLRLLSPLPHTMAASAELCSRTVDLPDTLSTKDNCYVFSNLNRFKLAPISVHLWDSTKWSTGIFLKLYLSRRDQHWNWGCRLQRIIIISQVWIVVLHGDGKPDSMSYWRCVWWAVLTSYITKPPQIQCLIALRS